MISGNGLFQPVDKSQPLESIAVFPNARVLRRLFSFFLSMLLIGGTSFYSNKHMGKLNRTVPPNLLLMLVTKVDDAPTSEQRGLITEDLIW